MERFNALPRELQLIVMQKFDMDTRIMTGVIGRIHVPTRLKDAIAKGFALRVPFPDWGKDKKWEDFLNGTISLIIPISTGCSYEQKHDGSFWLVKDVDVVEPADYAEHAHRWVFSNVFQPRPHSAYTKLVLVHPGSVFYIRDAS
jgi:hypothetical protein